MEDRFLIDHLKAMVFVDFRASIRAVREGEDPDRAFQQHEARVARLRRMIARLEDTEEPRPQSLRLVEGCGRDWKPRAARGKPSLASLPARDAS